MSDPVLIKNIVFSEPHILKELVEYQDNRVISLTLAQNEALSLTLFSFCEGEGLSTHSASGDAMVLILDGEATLNIGGKEVQPRTGEVVVMPADVPHSVHAHKPFKMLLIVVKKPK